MSVATQTAPIESAFSGLNLATKAYQTDVRVSTDVVSAEEKQVCASLDFEIC